VIIYYKEGMVSVTLFLVNFVASLVFELVKIGISNLGHPMTMRYAGRIGIINCTLSIAECEKNILFKSGVGLCAFHTLHISTSADAPVCGTTRRICSLCSDRMM